MADHLPADISAAIQAFEEAVEQAMFEGRPEDNAAQATARALLEATICRYLPDDAEIVHEDDGA